MANEVKAFNFESNEVRTVLIDNEPWFVGKDVADTLGYKNGSRDINSHVDVDDKLKYQISTSGQKREQIVINESGVFALIFGSELDSAKRFKKWVTSEVLPSIRKHGAYMTDSKIEEALTDPDTIIRLATTLKQERQEKLLLKQRVNELQPKADYTDSILQNKALVTITFIAKDYGMSGSAMNKLLHELGVQYKQGKTWLLYSKHQKKGWTQSETTRIQHADGTNEVVANTKWTQKGRLGLYELLKDNGVLPLIEQDQTA
ncbi:KilAC domain (KilAC) [Fructobacillus evanidus]|uniref:KilAC domain (KilAC) n=1 Tax=Fructobacillus evanidus TaxID=3064281 RepID=A0ABM9N1U4_9LACO|nr:KilAC domain (KilAC) [Fructobacillus sp. LMG 32999]CAK1243690.1 KilAC domain (KilAC) [Fructobacillus sp. LMG 32999]CAK1254217.1 KilAC domain (KilAC) [Fructobacillus sp. LMG 32999]CAK1254709.1 KilAC domain (KilAC) [Fructobacillus sp. LMG 32999]